MTHLFKLRKIGFRNGIGTDEVASILLYTDQKLVGYTNNTNWIRNNIFPDNDTVNHDDADDFTLFIAEIYNLESRLLHFFCWKHVKNDKSWVFIPDNFKMLQAINPPFLEHENEGHTLTTGDTALRNLFNKALQWSNIEKKPAAPVHKAKIRKRAH